MPHTAHLTVSVPSEVPTVNHDDLKDATTVIGRRRAAMHDDSSHVPVGPPPAARGRGTGIMSGEGREQDFQSGGRVERKSGRPRLVVVFRPFAAPSSRYTQAVVVTRRHRLGSSNPARWSTTGAPSLSFSFGGRRLLPQLQASGSAPAAAGDWVATSEAVAGVSPSTEERASQGLQGRRSLACDHRGEAASPSRPFHPSAQPPCCFSAVGGWVRGSGPGPSRP
jgi:hypothetical protein